MSDFSPSAPAVYPINRLEDQSTVDYESQAQIDDSEYRVTWANTMLEGNYARPSLYEEVAVMLLCWAKPSSNLNIDGEVDSLKKVFEDLFRYHVTIAQLDATQSEVQVNAIISNFVHAHNGSNTLLIVYYAGHGRPGDVFGELSVFGKGTRNDVEQVKKQRNGLVWNNVERLLSPAAGDVLEIFDCCYAGTLGLTRGEDRSFEYLAATNAMGTTPLPGEDSFTSCLIRALKNLVLEKENSPFTTDELLRKIKSDPKFPPEQTPVLSDRQKDHKVPSVGRIMLHPVRQGQKEAQASTDTSTRELADRHVVTLDFEFGEKPSQQDVQVLGRKFNDLFERNTLGVHRIGWGGIRMKAFGRYVNVFRGFLRERRASNASGQPPLGFRTSYRSSTSMTRLNTDFLSPQSAVFDPPDLIYDDIPSHLSTSSPSTSNTDGYPDQVLSTSPIENLEIKLEDRLKAEVKLQIQ
ncbi:MAG: hypothetical protein Q9220_002673 [cf. Caloplaca sp. 1 TL-2023]